MSRLRINLAILGTKFQSQRLLVQGAILSAVFLAVGVLGAFLMGQPVWAAEPLVGLITQGNTVFVVTWFAATWAIWTMIFAGAIRFMRALRREHDDR